MFTSIEMMTPWLSTLGPTWLGIMIATLVGATAGLVVMTHRRITLDAPQHVR